MEKLIKLIKELCLIPSPTGNENNKAKFIKKWLDEKGAKNCIIDEKNNVIFQTGNKQKPKIVFMAHIDTVFPFETKLDFVEDTEFLKCPSVGDNSSNVAGLMLTMEYLIENKINFKDYCLTFVFTSGEEGLGNLAGCKYFMKTHDDIKEVIAVDGTYGYINDNAVGSHRYEISVYAKGGHSFTAFGNDNAIHIISKLITDLYNIKIPKKEKTKTTYNVGTIKGGTTVNSIAEFASMLYEYRSDNYECLCYMKEEFDKVIKKHSMQNYKVEVKLVGERPCAKGVNQVEYEVLLKKIEDISEKVLGKKIARQSGSMDCNIPLSMGIPSSSIGIYLGNYNHTKEELVYKNSLKDGMQMLKDFVLSYRE